MNTLQKIFKKELKKILKPERIGTEIINKKLKDKGIELTESQIRSIKSQFKSPSKYVLNFEFEDKQVLDAGFTSKEQLQEVLQKIFSDLKYDAEKFCKNLLEDMPSFLEETIETMSKEIFKNLKNDLKRMLQERTTDFTIFNSGLFYIYGEAFDLLEMLIQISLEVGDSLNKEFYRSKSSVFDVLIRLHARACQIAYEILTLLKNGLADGAHARWRTLHEVTVTALYISDNSDEIAERYLLYDAIESYKAAKIYSENCEYLDSEPLTSEELSELQSNYDNLIERFGKNYKYDFGWVVLESNNEKPTFRGIERKVGLNHLRPYYNMACQNVHASPKGIFDKLGLYPDSGDVLLAGPSNIGLTDPGQLAALSLSQISITLLTHNSNLDRLIICKIISKLKEEIALAFIDAENSIENVE